MRTGILRNFIFSVVFLLFSVAITDAKYIEGIDTTGPYLNSYSYGLDSLFYFSNSTGVFKLYNGIGINYYYGSFDDIMMVPDTIRGKYGSVDILNPFVLWNTKDSTWLKIQIIKKTDSGKYIYKYGKNTTPNNKLLIDNGYDRSIKYKPNNLYTSGGYKDDGKLPYNFQGDTLFWDPPIPNNNHIKGYILYANSKRIDITKPIDLTQWDSIAFFTSSTRETTLSEDLHDKFINLVAVYQEGRSEFIDSWIMPFMGPIGVSRSDLMSHNMQKKLVISTDQHGLFIKVPFSSSADPFSVTIFNPNGTIHSSISGIKGSRAFLSAKGNGFTEGLYILRAEFQDRSVVTQPFTIVR